MMKSLKYNCHVGEGSHLPVLMNIFNITDGPVLELGMGLFSTPYLHWACYEKKRKLVSCESRLEWIEIFDFSDKREVRNDYGGYHTVYHVEDWDAFDVLQEHWSVVLIDHAPGPRRHVEAARLANNADYIVLHDTNGRHDFHYHYTKIYPLFKYRHNTSKIYPESSVVSNFKDVSKVCTL